jgi:hypothetical protein
VGESLKRGVGIFALWKMKVSVYISCATLLLFVGFNSGGRTTQDARVLVIPTVEHCAMVGNLDSYDGKEVRVHGIYTVCGIYDSMFFSSSCSDGKKVWVNFKPTDQSCSNQKAVESLAE